MICVIATAKVKPGKRAEFLEIVKSNVPNVQGETGCIEYLAVTDVDSGIDSHAADDHEVLFVEKWENLDALKAHLVTPHMEDFREKVKELVESISLRILG